MVITKIIGGMGNHLFQYAIGRQIALLNNVQLKLDISGFETYKIHKYSLHHFSLIEEIATPKDIAKLKIEHPIKKKINNFIEKFLPYYRHKVICQQSRRFDANMLKASGNVYLDGYWQCEKYFMNIEAIIRKEFAVKYSLKGKDKEIANDISKVNAVSLHIRRGNYASDEANMQHHGVCNLTYYKNAIEVMAQKVKNPHFFLFSDEMEWVRKNLNLNYPNTYVDHNFGFNGAIYQEDRNYEDIRLMSMCKHHIIANSTFSWWGAWLNPNPHKIVIAPKQWFNDGSDSTDIVPDQWIRL